jgi:TRAP-type mannitol/chloroaromatic compound transport system permease large subunit
VLLTVFYRSFTVRAVADAMLKTLRITSMIMVILLAGNMLTGVFVSAGGSALTHRLVDALALGPWGVLVLVLFLAFVAGFFLDWISIVLILVPIFAPVLRAQGVDLVWFCILFLIVIQTSYLTPPMAPAIFYLRGISPPQMTIDQMYRGVVPFIIAQLVCLLIVMAFPQTVLWLPSKLLGFR